MSGQIFISYRRQESGWSARSLHDRLCREFNPDQIFMDLDAISLGEDFVDAIETTVAICDVLVAVIGNNWLTSKDERGGRRLDSPEDFVRMEIGTALKRKIRVIPVLVDGALMPRADDLPEDLKPLVRRNALAVTTISFEGDCQRLAGAIRQVLEKVAAEERKRLASEQRQREEAEARQREKERLEAEQRVEAERLEADQREKESTEAERRERQRLEDERLSKARQEEAEQREKERLEIEQREKERLEAEQREKERLEAEEQEKERLATEQREKERQIRLAASEPKQGQSKGNIPSPSPEPLQNFASAQAESPPPIAQTKGPKKQKPWANRALLAVLALILIAGVIWFAGRNHSRTETVLVKPTPTPTPTATISPPSSDAAFYSSRGEDFYQRKDYDKAISEYDEAIRLDPNFAEAYNRRGAAYDLKKDYDKAISDYTEAIRLDPKYSKAYYNRALSYFSQGKYEQGQADFDKANQLGYMPVVTPTPWSPTPKAKWLQ
jgi:tetratricopeptide (TPR) repeat protein